MPNNTIITIGSFDGVHLGHQQLLRRLVLQATTNHLQPLVITFDHHPRQVLGSTYQGFGLLSSPTERNALIMEQDSKIQIETIHFTPDVAQLSACQFLETILVRQYQAKALLMGYDNMFGNHQHDDFAMLPDTAARLDVKIMHDTPLTIDGIPVSSTRIRQALQSGEVATANQMLGRPYSVQGKVVEGRHIGHQLGFPTANIATDADRLLPQQGVYVVRAFNSNNLPIAYGMANLGNQPTVGGAQEALETHLFVFDGNLYGQEVSIQFIARMRDICSFASTQLLRQQLQHDKQQAIKIIADITT
ncbi:MAG: riboflavin biosynthesis protein RibF [Bacteroidales bacterium]|nr:riboflavin biosynthesis protein RibF [Candidatus Colimorpha onthohippi]